MRMTSSPLLTAAALWKSFATMSVFCQQIDILVLVTIILMLQMQPVIIDFAYLVEQYISAYRQHFLTYMIGSWPNRPRERSHPHQVCECIEGIGLYYNVSMCLFHILTSCTIHIKYSLVFTHSLRALTSELGIPISIAYLDRVRIYAKAIDSERDVEWWR